MKKTFFFFVLVSILFSACEPEDDFPTIDSPKRKLTSLKNGDGTPIFEFAYSKDLIDSIVLHSGIIKRFKVSYTDGKVTGMRERFQLDPTGRLRYHDYSFTYNEESIEVKHVLDFEVGNIDPSARREVTKTYYLNETRERVTEIAYHVMRFSMDSTQTVEEDTRTELTWDENGENIIMYKRYEMNRMDPTAPKILSATLKYTYDDNPNPFWGLMHPFFIFVTDIEALHLSKNNIKTQELIFHSNPLHDHIWERAYTYGKKGFPERHVQTWDTGQNEWLYDYK